MTAADDNLKFAVPLADGPVVEAVYYASGTLCVSSQAGCAVGCPFCASGSRGLRRNLSAGEMARQLDAAAERGIAPARVTVSGIGEPLHNPEEVRSFLDLCRGRGLPASLTTTGASLSTLRSFLGLPHNGLMLSLHAGTADVHRRLVPRGPDFEGVWTLLAGTLPALSRRRRRKVGINYLLLAGVNDGDEELAALARRLRPYPELTVHLLTCNPVPGSTFTSPPPERVAAAATFLAGEGINTRLPNRWRTRLEGGCGTLFVRGL